MRKIVFLLILTFITMEIFAADTTTVFVNKRKVAEVINKDNREQITLLLKKSVSQNYKSLAVQVKNNYINRPVYKKELEITGDSTIIISETKNKTGCFTIGDPYIKKELTAGKTLKLYLLLNPANPMMMIPSRRIYVGDLVMK